MFPGGGPGVALLLIRVGVGLGLLLDSASRMGGVLGRWDFPVRIAIGAILLAGVLTPIVAVLAVALVVADCVLINATNLPTAILVSVDATALVLLGPGAYSIDARRFGRRLLMMSAESKGDVSARKH